MPKPNINPDRPDDRPVWTDTQDPVETDDGPVQQPDPIPADVPTERNKK